MPDISKLSGIDIDSIAKMSGVTKSSIAKVGGVSKAAAGLSIRTSDLQIWWEAADGDGGASPISSSHRRLVNKANSGGYSSPAIEGDHRLLNGSSSNWTTVGGVDAILLDGSNDNILTRQLYLGASPYNDPFNESLGSSNIHYHSWDDQYDNGDGFTVEIWVRSFGSTWAAQTNIFSAYQNHGFRLRTSSSGSNAPLNFIRIHQPSGTAVAWNPTETLPAGEWVHLTFTSDPGNQLALYKNAGTPSTNTNLDIRPSQTWVNSTMILGAYATSGSEAEKFYIGEYRMYDKVLSASDVLANYNATKSNYGIT